MYSTSRADIFRNLQADILRLQGFKPAKNDYPDMGLGFLKDAFPNASFPVGAVHEFLSAKTEDTAPVSGFIAGLLPSLMGSYGTTLWVSSAGTLFPPALKRFGLKPDRFIFINLQKEKDIFWVMDEALKCSALSAVVGEVRDMDFTTSRRLQLAVEQSQVTGFIIRNNYKNLNTTACVSRWKVAALPSESGDEMPGVGFPKWRVELLRMRNGKPGAWNILWKDGRFVPTEEASIFNRSFVDKPVRKVG